MLLGGGEYNFGSVLSQKVKDKGSKTAQNGCFKKA